MQYPTLETTSLPGAHRLVALLAVIGLSGGASAQINPVPSTPISGPLKDSYDAFCRTPIAVEGDIAADNFYGFYSASCEKPFMTMTQHGSGCETQIAPDAYSFVTNDHYFYIVAWSDDVQAQGLLHDLSFAGEEAFSGSPSWSVFATGLSRDTCGDAPSKGLIAEQVVLANDTSGWQATTIGPLNKNPDLGAYDWSPHPQISDQAHWVWYDDGSCPGPLPPFRFGCDASEFLIFRIVVNTFVGRATADNFLNVFTADSEGPDMRVTFRGSHCSWYTAETFVITTTDSIVYLVAWSDDNVQQGLLFNFVENGNLTLSSQAGWQVSPTDADLDSCTAMSTATLAALVQTAVQGATFVVPTQGGFNDGTFHWQEVLGIFQSARWIWYYDIGCPGAGQPFASGCDHGEALIFRRQIGLQCDCNYDAELGPGLTGTYEAGPAPDCNDNGVPDGRELAGDDCNQNGVPDGCDIAAGTSTDVDLDGIPDECWCSGMNFCTAVPNSTGSPGVMSKTGSCSIATNDVVLMASNLPPLQSGYFILSPDQDSVPLGDGNLCLGTSTLGFYAQLPLTQVGDFGTMSWPLDLSASPAPGVVFLPGSTWFFQAVYNDPNGGLVGFNLSDGYMIAFVP